MSKYLIVKEAHYSKNIKDLLDSSYSGFNAQPKRDHGSYINYELTTEIDGSSYTILITEHFLIFYPENNLAITVMGEEKEKAIQLMQDVESRLSLKFEPLSQGNLETIKATFSKKQNI